MMEQLENELLGVAGVGTMFERVETLRGVVGVALD
jgi:hypothetical protein